jgi:hypothetical protein
VTHRGRWEDLSPNYRKRLQRQGISQSDYESGASLAKARGHRTTEEENKRRRQLRKLRKFAKKQEDWYYRDADEVYEELKGKDLDLILSQIENQEEAERLWLQGDLLPARFQWLMRDPTDELPDWMHYYHAFFS